MSCSFSSEDIEALVRDELTDSRAARVAAHIADCASCRDEEDWLRVELAAFDARLEQAPGADDLWAGVEASIGEDVVVERPARSRNGGLIWFSSGFVAAAAVAAAVFLFALPTTTTTTTTATRPQPVVNVPVKEVGDKVLVALDKAEQQYLAALDVLRAEYTKRHSGDDRVVVLAYDKAMDTNLHRLRTARMAAGNDVEGRVRVLDAYSSYVLTLQSAVEGLDI